MSPFIAYHSTFRRHRESICRHGLLAGTQRKDRPFGVYVFRDDYSHPTFCRGFAVRWGTEGRADLWRVAYIGPMKPDYYVENGLVMLESVPPQHLSLITPITHTV